MQRWKEEFVPNTTRKCVHVHHNGDFEHGKVLYMESDWTYLDFLNAASQRLNMVPAAKRVFNADGVEIDDCMMIEDDDILFLSIHEDFIAPVDLLGDIIDSSTSGRSETEKIPHIVGGYKVGDLLGRGGFGEVRVGEHHLTGEKVALKFLRKSEIHSLNAAERTNTEIQCLQALKHANIIRLQQHMEAANHVVLIFELMEGGDLLKYLIKRKESGVRSKMNLTEDEARSVFYQVLSAVSYAHNQHICHRDLKLENILLKDNSLGCVKIADFGLSDFYRPGALIKSSCGTLSFLAPEVFRGTANAGPPLDVWSLGVILFALLCGRLPFEGPDLVGTKRPREAVIKARILKCQFKLDEALSPEAKDLVRRMLQLDPSERMTIPEIFNHVWVRVASSHHWMDNHLHQPTSFNHLSKDYHDPNNGSNNTVDFFSPFSAPARTKRGNSNPVELTSMNIEFKLKREQSFPEGTSALNSKQSSRTDLDLLSNTPSVRPTRSQSSIDDPPDLPDMSREIEPILEIEEPPITPAEPKSTIKLVPLRRNHQNDGSKHSKGGDDDDLLFSGRYLPPESPVQQFRPSTTIASGGKRNISSLVRPNNHDGESASPSFSGITSPTISHTSKNFSGYGRDIIHSVSPRAETEQKDKEKDTLYNLAYNQPNRSTSSTSSSAIYTNEIRRPSVPGASSTQSNDHSPNPKSHPMSAGVHRRDSRPVIPAGLASINSHKNGLPSHHHHDLGSSPTPIASPIAANLKKSHHHHGSYNSPSQSAIRARFN